MSSDDGAGTRVRERGGGKRYAHERIVRRKRGRPIRLASGILTVGAAAALVVLVAGRAAELVSLGPFLPRPVPRFSDTEHPLPSSIPFSPDSTSFVPDPASFPPDPTTFLLIARVVRNASLIVAGLATGIGGCLLCIAAIRARGWRHGKQPSQRF